MWGVVLVGFVVVVVVAVVFFVWGFLWFVFVEILVCYNVIVVVWVCNRFGGLVK